MTPARWLGLEVGIICNERDRCISIFTLAQPHRNIKKKAICVEFVPGLNRTIFRQNTRGDEKTWCLCSNQVLCGLIIYVRHSFDSIITGVGLVWQGTTWRSMTTGTRTSSFGWAVRILETVLHLLASETSTDCLHWWVLENAISRSRPRVAFALALLPAWTCWMLQAPPGCGKSNFSSVAVAAVARHASWFLIPGKKMPSLSSGPVDSCPSSSSRLVLCWVCWLFSRKTLNVRFVQTSPSVSYTECDFIALASSSTPSFESNSFLTRTPTVASKEAFRIVPCEQFSVT